MCHPTQPQSPVKDRSVTGLLDCLRLTVVLSAHCPEFAFQV